LRWDGRSAARLALAGAATAALGGLAFLIYAETRRAERDRHAILEQMRELERMIRRHDAQLFVEVESGHMGKRPESDPAHDAMLRDFELLSHLERLWLRDVVVTVEADTATATYGVEGQARSGGVPGLASQPVAVPRAGEVRFVRRGRGWAMTGHRFIP
jgi:hypothetical protein